MNTPPSALPTISLAGKRILDVGCYDGVTLARPQFAQAAERHGVDVDADAVARGTRAHPEFTLRVAGAESLPYPAERFDFVISKVTLLYTNIPVALAEIFRVLRPGGEIFLTMHDFRHVWGWLVHTRSPKRIIDHGYIFLASAIYIASGRIPRRPWKRTRETFQSVGSLRRDLTKAGFVDISFERTPKDFVIQARKP